MKSRSKAKPPKVLFSLIILALALLAILVLGKAKLTGGIKIDQKSSLAGFTTNTAKSSVPLEKLLSGGPAKDGIPAINSPKFTSLSQADFKDDVQGIFIELNGIRRFYPYNILVWHEIVNDTLGDKNIAVTFCPLCASAIVFDRNTSGEILQFGVSGLLFESNLVMYDTKTESLWSQARGEAIVGDYTGTKLQILPFQQITFAALKRKYPAAQILSTDTGFNRNYSFNPYSGYEETDEINFPVSVSDKRFKPKEIMYVVPLGGKSVAFPQLRLKDGDRREFTVEGQTLMIERTGEEIYATTDSQNLPGYFEMWFSWTVHHQQDGIILDL